MCSDLFDTPGPELGWILSDASWRTGSGAFSGKNRLHAYCRVCGTAVKTGSIQRVDDVHLFPGHIACDSASASEIVLPLTSSGALYGVLDIDSPILSRFDAEDEEGLKETCHLLMTSMDWTGGILP